MLNPITDYRDSRLVLLYTLVAVPFLTRTVLGAVVGRLAAPLVGRLFVGGVDNPKSYGGSKMPMPYSKEELLSDGAYSSEQISVTNGSSDKFGLDCKILKRKQEDEKKTRSIIVYFCGKRDTYQSSEAEVLRDMKATGTDAFMFNYRGGGNTKSSAPRKFQDMVDDAKAVLKYLHNTQGYKYEHMILKGHSTGGPVLLQAARQLFEEDKARVGGCFADRPFSSLTDVVRSTLRQLLYFRLLGFIADYVTHWIVCPLLKYANWETNVLENYNTLVTQEVPVRYVNVHAENPTVGGRDTVIGEGSLYNAIFKAEPTEQEREWLRAFYTFSLTPSVQQKDRNQGHSVAMSCLQHKRTINGKEVTETANAYFDRFVSKNIPENVRNAI